MAQAFSRSAVLVIKLVFAGALGLVVAAVFVYCGVVTFIILKVIDIIVGLRVSPEVEVEGLDINLHGETVHD